MLPRTSRGINPHVDNSLIISKNELIQVVKNSNQMSKHGSKKDFYLRKGKWLFLGVFWGGLFDERMRLFRARDG
jgi:hypothetical protein